MKWLRPFLHRDDAQDLIEYALILAFVCFAALVGVRQVGTGVTGAYQNISAGLPIGPGMPSDTAGNGVQIRAAGAAATGESCRGAENARTSNCPSSTSR
jgi:Flp pilus assembly pilin Flp